MAMTLNDVPKSGQSLGQTRVPINQNFQVIDAAFQVDHQGYNLTGQGKHNKVTFPVQASAPVFAAGEMGLFNLLNPNTNVNELYVNQQDGTQTPLTAGVNGSTGWFFLPNGLLVKYGQSSTSGSPQPYPFTFPVNAGTPVFASCFWAMITPIGGFGGGVDPDIEVTLQKFTETTLTIWRGFRTTTVGKTSVGFQYIAFGTAV
jgi:hypothetical protein